MCLHRLGRYIGFYMQRQAGYHPQEMTEVKASEQKKDAVEQNISLFFVGYITPTDEQRASILDERDPRFKSKRPYLETEINVDTDALAKRFPDMVPLEIIDMDDINRLTADSKADDVLIRHCSVTMFGGRDETNNKYTAFVKLYIGVSFDHKGNLDQVDKLAKKLLDAKDRDERMKTIEQLAALRVKY
jgi:hypothetical protein